MGSYIPGLLEGAPLHNDNFQLTFNLGTGSVNIGDVVTNYLSGTTMSIKQIAASTDFPMGVVVTSGQLSSGIDVVCRGLVQVKCDNTTAVGDYLIGSTTGGYMHSVGTTPNNYGGRVICMQAATFSLGYVLVLALFL